MVGLAGSIPEAGERSLAAAGGLWTRGVGVTLGRGFVVGRWSCSMMARGKLAGGFQSRDAGFEPSDAVLGETGMHAPAVCERCTEGGTV